MWTGWNPVREWFHMLDPSRIYSQGVVSSPTSVQCLYELLESNLAPVPHRLSMCLHLPLRQNIVLKFQHSIIYIPKTAQPIHSKIWHNPKNNVTHNIFGKHKGCINPLFTLKVENWPEERWFLAQTKKPNIGLFYQQPPSEKSDTQTKRWQSVLAFIWHITQV